MTKALLLGAVAGATFGLLAAVGIVLVLVLPPASIFLLAMMLVPLSTIAGLAAGGALKLGSRERGTGNG
jgi:hypothetical protein